MTFTGALDSAVFWAFLGLLLRATRKKLYVVLDRLQAHIGAEVAAWVAAQGGRIELVPLPKYSPELNPVEYLNHDVKEEVNAEGLPADASGLHDNLDGFLHRLAYWPERILHYFCHPAVRYAAADD